MTSEPLSPLEGTPAYAVEVSWTDQDIPANQTVSIHLRHMYLRLLKHLPGIDGTPDNPADPGPPAVQDLPASPTVTITDIFNGEPGATMADLEPLLNDLLQVVSGKIAIGVEGSNSLEYSEANPSMIQATSNFLLNLQMAGVISGVDNDQDPPVVIMASASLETLERWRDLPQSQQVINELLVAGEEARINFLPERDQFGSTSLQHLIRFEYVQRGNEVIFDAMSELHDALTITEKTMGILNRVADILNQKDPEEAKLDIAELLVFHRDRPPWNVDSQPNKDNDNRDPAAYAAYLDSWENRQFNRELGTEQLDLGTESLGFLQQYNRNFGLVPETATQVQASVAQGDGITQNFTGQIDNDFVPVYGFFLTDGREKFIIDPDADLSDPTATVNLISVIDQGGPLVPLGGVGTLNRGTGEWDVTFTQTPREGRDISVTSQYAAPVQVSGEIIGSGDNTTNLFTGRTDVWPVLGGTFKISDGEEIFSEYPQAGSGFLLSDKYVGDPLLLNPQDFVDGITPLVPGVGIIDYDTGEFEVQFANAPDLGVDNIRTAYVHNKKLEQRTIATGDGVETTFEGRLLPSPLTEESLRITIGEAEYISELPGVGTVGNIVDAVSLAVVGTIDYATGEYVLNALPAAPEEGVDIIANWFHPPTEPLRIEDEIVANLNSDITLNPNQFDGRLEQVPVLRSDNENIQVLIEIDGQTFRDDGNGNLLLVSGTSGVGTIDYVSGTFTLLDLPNPVTAATEATVDYTWFDGVPNDDAQILTHIGAQVQQIYDELPAGDLKDAVKKILDDLTGFSFKPDLNHPEFNLNAYIEDFQNGAEGDYQRNVNAAIVAAQSLNDTQKEELRRRMFEFEEFYKSASAVISKITQILERIAQGIAR